MSTNDSSQIVVKYYEPWMHDQVVSMFCRQYGMTEVAQRALFERFYEHPFQLDACMRLVAVSGDRVAGMVTFFYWPYSYAGTILRCYQAGDGLVHPDFRRRGIFRLLFRTLDDGAIDHGVDFGVGFPVPAAIAAEKKAGWNDLLYLNWYVKVVSPISLLLPTNPDRIYRALAKDPMPVENAQSQFSIRLSDDPDFLSWRQGYSTEHLYAYFHHNESGKRVRFDLRLNARSLLNRSANQKGLLREMMIGGIHCSSGEAELVTAGLQALVRTLKKARIVVFLSIALNESSEQSFVLEGVRKAQFRRINRRLCFLTKAFAGDEDLLRPELWNVFRGDIDTW